MYLKINFTKLVLIFTFVLMNVFYIQGQNQTIYEKKKSELQTQIALNYGLNALADIQSIEEEKGEQEILKQKDAATISTLLLGYPTNITSAVSFYAKELKKIQGLKTNIDFQRDKVEEKKREQKKYEETDIGEIKKNIKTAFDTWNKKGEFEKEIDYPERLKTHSISAFENICIKEIWREIDNKNTGFSNQPFKMHNIKLNYNSEKEFFDISFELFNGGLYFKGIQYKGKIYIPLEQAQKFKQEINEYGEDTYIDYYDWCLVGNDLTPTIITLNNYKVLVTLVAPKEIMIPFNELNINNQNLNDYIFNYSIAKDNARAIAKQEELKVKLLDSLELVAFNNRLDSSFNACNRKLLENPYNLDKIVIQNYERISSNLEKGWDDRTISTTRQRKYYDNLSEINTKYRDISDKLEWEHQNKYKKNGNLFLNEKDFDSFYTKGNDVYQTTVEKKTVLKKMSKYYDVLESMDFRKETKESIVSALGRGLLGFATNSNISPSDYTDENEIRKDIINMVVECQEKIYFNDVINYVINTNKKLNNEWTKNGQYFENKVDFFESYVSDNYKQILKQKQHK